jgi:hypothetical protein
MGKAKKGHKILAEAFHVNGKLKDDREKYLIQFNRLENHILFVIKQKFVGRPIRRWLSTR